MLIDLYERPNSPEAPKSRAFIDKVFSLSGPDGGVVGGEDGIYASRPLRDGGREAWDMMRRLREKAWLKAGLQPEILWTEHAQKQNEACKRRSLGTAATRTVQPLSQGPKGSQIPNIVDNYYLVNEPQNGRIRERVQPTQEQQRKETPAIFQQTAFGEQNKNSTSIPQEGYAFPSSATNIRQSPPYPLQFPQQSAASTNPIATHSIDTTNLQNNPHSNSIADPPVTFPGDFGDSIYNSTLPTNLTSNILSNSLANANDFGAIPGGQNINFDWDRWDAVFGHSIPVVDGYMDLDKVTEPTSQASPTARADERALFSSSSAQFYGSSGLAYDDNTVPRPGHHNVTDFG